MLHYEGYSYRMKAKPARATARVAGTARDAELAFDEVVAAAPVEEPELLLAPVDEPVLLAPPPLLPPLLPLFSAALLVVLSTATDWLPTSPTP